jgi:hypothetical protein
VGGGGATLKDVFMYDKQFGSVDKWLRKINFSLQGFYIGDTSNCKGRDAASSNARIT